MSEEEGDISSEQKSQTSKQDFFKDSQLQRQIVPAYEYIKYNVDSFVVK